MAGRVVQIYTWAGPLYSNFTPSDRDVILECIIIFLNKLKIVENILKNEKI